MNEDYLRWLYRGAEEGWLTAEEKQELVALGDEDESMTPGHYEVHEAKDGAGFFWLLKAANGETLAMSELYSRRADAERGVEDAKAAREDG